MANFNKVMLMGNLTRDPELRYTPQGTAVAKLGIAVNRRWKDKNGELKDEVCYVTANVWDKQAEVCNQYLQKGRPVFIEGRLQYRSWQDNSGQKRNSLEVRVERIQFLGQPQAAQLKTEAAPVEEAAPQEAPAGNTDIPVQDDISWMEGETKGVNE